MHHKREREKEHTHAHIHTIMYRHPSRGGGIPRGPSSSLPGCWLLALCTTMLSSSSSLSDGVPRWAQVSHYVDDACTIRSQDYYYKMDTCFRVLPPGGAVASFKLVTTTVSGASSSSVEKLTYGTSTARTVPPRRACNIIISTTRFFPFKAAFCVQLLDSLPTAPLRACVKRLSRLYQSMSSSERAVVNERVRSCPANAPLMPR